QAVEAAAVGADPERAVLVLLDRAHHAVAEPLLRAVGREAAVAQGGEAVVRPDPERPRPVLVHHANNVAGQPVQAAVARELVGMVAGEAPAVGSDPERAVSPLDERLDAVAVERLRVPRVVVHEPYTVEAGEAAVGAQPEIAVPGLDEGGDRVL